LFRPDNEDLVIVPLTDAGKDFRLNRVSELIKAHATVQ